MPLIVSIPLIESTLRQCVGECEEAVDGNEAITVEGLEIKRRLARALHDTITHSSLSSAVVNAVRVVVAIQKGFWLAV